MSSPGPLHGLRIVDLTDDLGRFATKLLAECGATVWRPPGRGKPGLPMTGRAGSFGGVLDWWFDRAKVPVDFGLDDPSSIDAYRRLAVEADLIIESAPPGRLAELGIDHGDLVADNPTLTQISLTPFGRTGPRASWHSSDLVAGALSGVLSITGTEAQPLNSWGDQNFNFGGFAAALCGLSGVYSARRTGRGQLVDVSLHEVMTGSIENLLMQYFYDDHLPMPSLAPRQGSLHWLGAYQVVPAQTGTVMITPTPDTDGLVAWMVEEGFEEATSFVGCTSEEVLERVPELMAVIGRFAATKPASELFAEAQRRHVAFGEVQGPTHVVDNPQFAHRGFFSDVDLGGDERVRTPWRLVRLSDTPVAKPLAPSTEVATVAQVLAEPREEAPTAAAHQPDTDKPDPAAKPLAGLTVLDLSWVLAGPFATRLLGDLGADVIKVQTEERATLVNRPDYPYFAVWNRSKQSVSLDLKHPDALDVVRQLVCEADVLVENYSSGVLERLGLGWEQVHEWNERLVYISMSGCGHDGPWSNIISYAPTVHALCGLTHLTNPPGRGDVGCGFSLNDHAAGFAAAFSVMAALEARERTGRGQHIDMAQLEVGAYLVGPAALDLLCNGREAEAVGNRDALADTVPNEVFLGGDGRHVAVSATDDAMWARLAPLIGLADEDLHEVEGRRTRRGEIDAALAQWCCARSASTAMDQLQEAGVAAGVVQNAKDLAEHDLQLAAREFWREGDSGVFGPRRHDRFPALWSSSALDPYRLAPDFLGADNFDVLVDRLGLEADVVAEGMADGLFR